LRAFLDRQGAQVVLDAQPAAPLPHSRNNAQVLRVPMSGGVAASAFVARCGAMMFSGKPPGGGTPIGANRVQWNTRRTRTRTVLPLPGAGHEY
jgi:hypothetical protein